MAGLSYLHPLSEMDRVNVHCQRDWARESDAMTEAAVTDEVIRRFLLGDLDDRERERVEEVFLSDPRTRDRILMTEDDLIEGYLEDCLNPVELEKFLKYYLCASQQRRKLRIAKSLREYFMIEGCGPFLLV
jgi:hypothetical protein